ncbi:hypothetical protein HMI56_005019 [Coelomomyces lativittatus]|nr:hypothetical protein HMI56_005019 [Coelomomyces lativittatus]
MSFFFVFFCIQSQVEETHYSLDKNLKTVDAQVRRGLFSVYLSLLLFYFFYFTSWLSFFSFLFFFLFILLELSCHLLFRLIDAFTLLMYFLKLLHTSSFFTQNKTQSGLFF